MFYPSIYIQSTHGQSAIISGINSLPFLASFALGAMLSGTIIRKTRHLQPYQLASALMMTASMALLYTLDIDSSKLATLALRSSLGLVSAPVTISR